MNFRSKAPMFALLLLMLSAVSPASGYSLLTHEQLIDLTWQSSIVPLLRSRYPGITETQIEHARAYAYGGCVIQDIGYYPLGDPFFSDLTHYVRSGDFVVNLFRNASNSDELAFAVGALSHYLGDSVGHPLATNVAVPVEFPRLRARYGDTVNYAQGEHQHGQTEFAFDVNEITHHRLAPAHYLSHVGFQVPVRQVSLAFYQTYGLREDFNSHSAARLNVNAFRFAARRFIPRVAYALGVLRGRQQPAEHPDAELQRLDALVATVNQENHWAQYRHKPGIGTYTLAGFIFILPKIGELKLVAVKGPTEQTEKAYIHSVLASVDELDLALRRFTPSAATLPALATGGAGEQTLTEGLSAAETHDIRHPLVNRDLDTGRPVRPAGYRLTDDTYARLLIRLTKTPTEPIPPGIRSDIARYYSDMSLPFATKRKPGDWAAVQENLKVLDMMPTSTEPDPFPTYGEQAATERH